MLVHAIKSVYINKQKSKQWRIFLYKSYSTSKDNKWLVKLHSKTIQYYLVNQEEHKFLTKRNYQSKKYLSIPLKFVSVGKWWMTITKPYMFVDCNVELSISNNNIGYFLHIWKLTNALEVKYNVSTYYYQTIITGFWWLYNIYIFINICIQIICKIINNMKRWPSPLNLGTSCAIAVKSHGCHTMESTSTALSTKTGGLSYQILKQGTVTLFLFLLSWSWIFLVDLTHQVIEDL